MVSVLVIVAAAALGAYYYVSTSGSAAQNTVSLHSFYLHNIYGAPLNSSFGPAYQNLCAQGLCNTSLPLAKSWTIDFNLGNGGGSSMTVTAASISTGFHLSWLTPSSGPPFQVPPGQGVAAKILVTVPSTAGTYDAVLTLSID